MATRIYCDRCGQEVEGLPFALTYSRVNKDLCQKCKKAFEAFMNGAEPISEVGQE